MRSVTPNTLAKILTTRLHELPHRFQTRDVFKFYNADQNIDLRSYATVALRKLERQGLVKCAGKAANNCVWEKVIEPKEVDDANSMS